MLIAAVIIIIQRLLLMFSQHFIPGASSGRRVDSIHIRHKKMALTLTEFGNFW